MFSCSAIPRYFCLQFLAVLMVFLATTTDAFYAQHPTTAANAPTRRMVVSSGSSLPSVFLRKHESECHQQMVAHFAANSDINNDKVPIADRSYDFIAVEEAEKMLQQERLKHEKEVHDMKHLLKRQHEQLREFDSLDSNIQLQNHKDPGTVDLGFDGSDDRSINAIDNNYINDYSSDDNALYSPYSNIMDEQKYKQQRQKSHDAAECRTLKIALHQIDKENEELEDECIDQQQSYQSDIEEMRRTLRDVQDRSNCIKHELKTERSYFERAKEELESVLNQERSKIMALEQQLSVLDQERSKAMALEQQLLIARREQQILEEAAIEARRRHQQELQEREEYQRQQRLLQQEQEEHQRQQQLLHQKQEEERLYQEQLLQEHQELRELQRHQEQLNNICFNLYNDDSIDESDNDHHIPNSNRNQRQQAVFGADGGLGPDQCQYSVVDSARSVHSTQSTHFTQHDATQQQQQTVTVTVTTQTTNPRQEKREPRTNSHAHGLFTNFNDILM